jgi:hypothetical protein
MMNRQFFFRTLTALFIFSSSLIISAPVYSASNATRAKDESFQEKPNNNIATIYQGMLQERTKQATINKQRETSFLLNKSHKQTMLKALKVEHEQKKLALSKLKTTIQETAKTLDEKKLALKERTHALRDLFSAWKQVVKDSKSNTRNSLITHQFPDQLNHLHRLDAPCLLRRQK